MDNANVQCEDAGYIRPAGSFLGRKFYQKVCGVCVWCVRCVCFAGGGARLALKRRQPSHSSHCRQPSYPLSRLSCAAQATPDDLKHYKIDPAFDPHYSSAGSDRYIG